MGHNNAGYGATDEEWDLPFNCRYDTVIQRNTNTLTTILIILNDESKKKIYKVNVNH